LKGEAFAGEVHEGCALPAAVFASVVTGASSFSTELVVAVCIRKPLRT
jgi:hypothetical protein